MSKFKLLMCSSYSRVQNCFRQIQIIAVTALISLSFQSQSVAQEYYSERPNVTHMQPASGFSERWQDRHGRMFIESIAFFVEFYPDAELMFLARDAEYLYDFAKVALAKHEKGRVHLVDISTALCGNSMTPEYLRQFGLTITALKKGKQFLFIDSGFTGTVPNAIFEQYPRELRPQLHAHLIKTTSYFYAGFETAGVAGLSGDQMESLPHFNGSGVEYVKSGGVLDVQSDLPKEKETEQARDYMRELRYFALLKSNVDHFQRRRRMWREVRHLTVTFEGSYEDFQKEVQKIFARYIRGDSKEKLRKAMLSDLMQTLARYRFADDVSTNMFRMGVFHNEPYHAAERILGIIRSGDDKTFEAAIAGIKNSPSKGAILYEMMHQFDFLEDMPYRKWSNRINAFAEYLIEAELNEALRGLVQHLFWDNDMEYRTIALILDYAKEKRDPKLLDLVWSNLELFHVDPKNLALFQQVADAAIEIADLGFLRELVESASDGSKGNKRLRPIVGQILRHLITIGAVEEFGECVELIRSKNSTIPAAVISDAMIELDLRLEPENAASILSAMAENKKVFEMYRWQLLKLVTSLRSQHGAAIEAFIALCETPFARHIENEIAAFIISAKRHKLKYDDDALTNAIWKNSSLKATAFEPIKEALKTKTRFRDTNELKRRYHLCSGCRCIF